MIRYMVQRLLMMLPVMAVVALVVFLLLHLAPGDPAAVMAGENATAEQIADIRTRLGLDQPLPVQFFIWVMQLLHGDLGKSIFTGLPVGQLIGQSLGPTLSLAAVTLLLSVCFGVTLGVLAAARAGKPVDRLAMFVAIIGFSIPVFVTGYILVYVFAIVLNWLPVQGYSSITDGIGPFLRRIILPSVALSFSYLALISRITRASVLEVLAQDYIRTAYAKGLGEANVLQGHVLKNASVPIATVIGNGIALLIGGVVVTESVFSIPGIGRLVVDAITRRDYPVIQGVTLVFSAIYASVNLGVDLVCALLDPRIRL